MERNIINYSILFLCTISLLFKKYINIEYDLVIPTNNINTFLNNKDYFKKFLK